MGCCGLLSLEIVKILDYWIWGKLKVLNEINEIIKLIITSCIF